MPELPEVETLRRQLEEILSGKEITSVSVLRDKSFLGDERELLKKKILAVERKAKVLVFKFERWNKLLMIHLKMTGQLVWQDGPKGKEQRCVGGHPTADWVRDLPGKHTRVIIVFKDGSKLFFNDLRVFGWMKVTRISDFKIYTNQLPPDVIDASFNLKYLKKLVENSKRVIKLVLMDQSNLGGVGNIYANDALFWAKIDPRRRAESLGVNEIQRLYKGLKEVIAKGVSLGGATATDDQFVNVSGFGGKYQEHFLVYGRKGENCRNCGTKIVKIKLGGRGTYYCPKCQN